MKMFISIFFMLTTAISFASVSREQRALLAIVDLAEEASSTKWMYRLEGKAAVNRIERLIGESYSKKIIHKKKEATLENFLNSLKSLLGDESVQKIDVIIYIHGKNPDSPYGAAVCFVGTACTPVDYLSTQIRNLSPENSHKLRMLYSDACWGQYHMNAWLDAGFRVVNGSLGVDANHSADLRRFLKQWSRGETYETGIEKANSFWLTPLVDRVIGEANSIKLMAGEIQLTIDSE
ncbi:MAG: hypothetical protein K2P81_04375 [Bacteriovoracaceae bacterium]|nr:hypothetical protein [Bacteriovoracaceae bacterium]